MTIRGPYDDNYLKTDQFGLESTVWSPCGVEGLLNINSEVRISPGSGAAKNGLLTVKSLESIRVHWQTCGGGPLPSPSPSPSLTPLPENTPTPTPTPTSTHDPEIEPTITATSTSTAVESGTGREEV